MLATICLEDHTQLDESRLVRVKMRSVTKHGLSLLIQIVKASIMKIISETMDFILHNY